MADSEGFWREFFLLRPDKSSLQQKLEQLSTDDLLELQVECVEDHFLLSIVDFHQHGTQQLFVRAVNQMKTGKAPSDEVALDVSLTSTFMRPCLTLTGSDFDSLLRFDPSETIP